MSFWKPILVQEYLKGGGTLKSLEEKYHLLIRRGKEFPNLVLFKYHQIESPMSEPLVRQCRGLILDEADNWNIVARPFDKFFNLGEGLAAEIDWRSARVQEKLDGSLMQLYWYRDAWRVASSGTPDASGEVNGCGFTFAELFWRVFAEKGYWLPVPEFGWDFTDRRTFLFELMTPYNRVVVQHKTNDLKLIGCREFNGYETPVDFAADVYGFEAVRSLPLQTAEEIMLTFATMDPLKQEGYVVVDDNANRVKVKHPGYVAIHHLRDGFGPRRILEVIRSGESSELLTYFPEWTEAFEKIATIYSALVIHLNIHYEAIKGIESQKEFALEAVKSAYSPALFQLRKGQVTDVRQSLAKMPIKNLMELLKLKDIEL